MKFTKGLALAMAVCAFSAASADEKKNEKKSEVYEFKMVKEIPATPVKSQDRTSTCWCFSTISFLESEIMRNGGPELDLSEMFVVRKTWEGKVENYVRMHGKTNFGPGGWSHDVTNAMGEFGLVPQDAYQGNEYGTDKHIHGEMDKMLTAMVNAVISNPNKTLTTQWDDAIDGTLDAYLGELPETFMYEGKKYTPETFSKEVCKLNAEDYVEVTSYTHHPFYTTFPLEIPDNWSWDHVYNVPLADFDAIVENSIDNGYTVGWGSDVSDKGFATRKEGVAVVPAVDQANTSGSDQERWVGLSKSEKEGAIYSSLDGPIVEKEVTQELRQEHFDNYQSTDDHGMHIIGKAVDQTGKVFFYVKNSWGDYNGKGGYFYVSKAFINLRSTGIMVHKDAIPAAIKAKMGL